MKKYIYLICALMFVPQLVFAKEKVFKIYLSVGGDETFTDTFADALRQELRKNNDVVFVGATKAEYVITAILMQEKNVGGDPLGFTVAWSFNMLCTNPNLYILSGSNDLQDLVTRTVADIDESVLEPLREAAVK